MIVHFKKLVFINVEIDFIYTEIERNIIYHIYLFS